jgi:esterase/lipase
LSGTFLRYLYPFQPKWFGSAINDPNGRKAFKSYFLMPLASVMEIIKLQEEVRKRLEKITVPTLILHSRHDTTAPFESVAYLENHLGSRQIQAVVFEKSNHVLTLDYDKKEVISAVTEFFGGIHERSHIGH